MFVCFKESARCHLRKKTRVLSSGLSTVTKQIRVDPLWLYCIVIGTFVSDKPLCVDQSFAAAKISYFSPSLTTKLALAT